MSITRYFDLYLNAGSSIPLVVNASQYDQGETWVFTLYSSNGVQYTPTTGAIVGIKSDGNLIANAGTVDGQGRVVITETQQMTAAAGKAIFELQIDNDTHGTANFIVLVEPSPADGGVLSDSDLSMIEEVLSRPAYGSPLVANTASAMTDHTKVYVYTGSEQGYTNGDWYYWDGDSWEDGGTYNSQGIGAGTVTGTKLSSSIRDSIYAFLEKCALTVPNGLTLLAAVHGAFYDVTVESISATFTQGENLVFSCDSLDSLKQYLTVDAEWADGTTSEVVSYTLIGELTAGTSTITAEYMGKSTTFTVNVTAGEDVAPAFSSFVDSTYCKKSVSGDTMRVYCTSSKTYQGVSATFTQESGYTYRLMYDVAIVAGTSRAAFTNSSNTSTGGTSYLAEDGHNEKDIAYDATTAKVFLYCAGSTAVKGDVTFSNFRIIKYIAEA